MSLASGVLLYPLMRDLLFILVPNYFRCLAWHQKEIIRHLLCPRYYGNLGMYKWCKVQQCLSPFPWCFQILGACRKELELGTMTWTKTRVFLEVSVLFSSHKRIFPRNFGGQIAARPCLLGFDYSNLDLCPWKYMNVFDKVLCQIELFNILSWRIHIAIWWAPFRLIPFIILSLLEKNHSIKVDPKTCIAGRESKLKR